MTAVTEKNAAQPLFSLRYLFKGSLIYGSSDLFVAMLRFALLAVYTRYLSPAEFGVLALLQTTILLLSTLAPLGLPSAIMIRFREKEPGRMKEMKDAAFFFMLCASLGAGLVTALLVFRFYPEKSSSQILGWCMLWTVANILQFVPAVSLRFKENIVSFGMTKVAGAIVMVATIFFLTVGKNLGLQGIIMAEALGSATVLCFSFILDRYRPALPPKGIMRGLIVTGLPLCLISLGVVLIDFSDRYVVYAMMGGNATGYYAAAAKIAFAACFIAEAFNSMWTPHYYRMAGNTEIPKEQFHAVAKKLSLLFAAAIGAAMIALPLLADFSIFGRPFVAPAYHGVKVLIAPLTLMYFFKMIFYITTPPVTFNERNWKLSGIIYAAVFVNIAGKILILKLFAGHDLYTQLYLVALVSSLSYCICAALGFIEVFKLHHYSGSMVTHIFIAVALSAAILLSPLPLNAGIWIIFSLIFGYRFLKKRTAA